MEKGTAHCKLPAVKALIEAGKVKATASAFGGARALGINDLAGMCSVVMALTSAEFFKSMTTHAGSPHLAGRVPRQDSNRLQRVPEAHRH
jgi:motility quorum-sensing regulator / GCU-specific mRNA interferase toxin